MVSLGLTNCTSTATKSDILFSKRRWPEDVFKLREERASVTDDDIEEKRRATYQVRYDRKVV